MKATAEMFDKMYPGCDISDAQKQERAERIVFRNERQAGYRTGRNRGIVVPDLPWLNNKEKDQVNDCE